MNAVVYLFQVSACMGIFYLFYYLLLSRYTFFTTNRWYLIGTLAMSFIIPLLTITVQQQETYPQVIKQVVYINQMQMPQPVVVVANEAPQQVQINWMGVVKIIYMVSVAALLLRLMLMVVKFFTRVKGKKSTKIDGVHIVQGDENLRNGSFFNFIFLNDDELSADELEQIIAHEMLHVKLYHSVDRILVKIAQVFLWFNPFVYLYARAIEENHEFEVDRAISNATDRNKYAELLFHLSVARQGTLYHNFSMVPLKKRITMLFTKPTNRMKRIIYLLVVPVVLISCLAFARLKNESAAKIKKHAIPVADSAGTVKYRQKSKLTPAQRDAQDESFKNMRAYFDSPEGKKKVESARAVMEKTLTFVVEDDALALTPNPVKNDITYGLKLKGNGGTYSMFPARELKNLKKGDVIEVKILATGYNRENPLVNIMPEWVTKEGKKIFEAEKIKAYPFGYEANKVRFSYGKFTAIEKYPNGKWKTAIFESTGYKFNLSFKPNAPDLNKVKIGEEVTLRFIHEVKTGDKTYKISDWVAISTDIKDYGIKNPDWFLKFYELVSVKTKDTVRLSVIDYPERLQHITKVTIDGKDYPTDILYKIGKACIKSRDWKGTTMAITTKNGEITYQTPQDKANLKADYAQKDKFFSRILMKRNDGSTYYQVRLKRATGGYAMDDIGMNDKVGFVVNNKLYSEKEFVKLFPKDDPSYGRLFGVGPVSKDWPRGNFDTKGYNEIFTLEQIPDDYPKSGSIQKQPDVSKSNEALAKLSGFEVKADGSTWFNGKKVNKVMVDGKEFVPDAKQRPEIKSESNTAPNNKVRIMVDGKEFVPDAKQGPEIKSESNTAPNNKVRIMVDGKEFVPNPEKAPTDTKGNNGDVIKKDLINSIPVLKSTYKNVNDSLVAARFSGKVMKVAEIFGDYLVIIKNGEYFAAYANLKNVNVSNGQEIKAGQVLGSTAPFSARENELAMPFQLYRNSKMITDKSEQEVIIRDLGQQRLNMRLKLGEVYAFNLK